MKRRETSSSSLISFFFHFTLLRKKADVREMEIFLRGVLHGQRRSFYASWLFIRRLVRWYFGTLYLRRSEIENIRHFSFLSRSFWRYMLRDRYTRLRLNYFYAGRSPELSPSQSDSDESAAPTKNESRSFLSLPFSERTSRLVDRGWRRKRFF